MRPPRKPNTEASLNTKATMNTIRIGTVVVDVSIICAVKEPELFGMDGKGCNPRGLQIRWWASKGLGLVEMPPAEFMYPMPYPRPICDFANADDKNKATRKEAELAFKQVIEAMRCLV